MKKILAENYDVECGFIIVDSGEGDYYYIEWDILEDVEGINETNEQLYSTRDYDICSFEISNFDGEDVGITTTMEIAESIGYNNCLIKDSCLTKSELDCIITSIKS